MRLFLRRFFLFASLQFLALFCSALTIIKSAQGTTLTVTNAADSGAGSLRDTIAAANDGDTIQFDPALNGQNILLTGGELLIAKNITINGPGPDLLDVTRDASPPPVARRRLAHAGYGAKSAGSAPAGDDLRIFHITPTHVATIKGLTISGAYIGGVAGGILNEQGALTLDHCLVERNVGYAGAGIYNSGATATLTLLNSTINFNVTNGGGEGAGIYNSGGTVTITGSVISSNVAPSFPGAYGGGIYNGGGRIDLCDSIIEGNGGGIGGGGIYNSGGTLTIVSCTIRANHAGTNFDGTGLGGGIFNAGTLAISNSTISGNVAASVKTSGAGGGIDNFGPLAISNSTISNNFANEDGGGIISGGSGATLTITNSTFSGNRANGNGGGIYNLKGGTLHVGNTILNKGTSGVNILNSAGTVTSDGYNLSSDDGGGFLTGSGDQINTDPMLGPLQDNGGPTFTHLPLSGSPAINAGDPNFPSEILYDQRGPGFARVFYSRLDIGSVEVQPTPIPTPTPSPSPTPTSTPTPTVTPPSLGNISTRLRVETGDNVLIGGFIITGNMSKGVVLRGIGPSLAQFGLSPVLTDPTLELRGASGALIFQNDDWQDNSQQAAQLSALGLAPHDAKESGIVATLTPAAYTAVLAGRNNGTGLGLVEIYDTNQGTGSQLANISTRGLVQTGNNVMIGGFILGGGSGTSQIVVRGMGPSLAQFGLSPILTDPTLELRNADGALLLSNDNWQDDPTSAAQLSSHNLAPQNPKESGIYAVFSPGAFTAILAGKSGGTGIGLVEIYNVP